MSFEQVKGWFCLTRKEQCIIAGLTLLFLVGLVARYVHLRSQQSETVDVEDVR